MKYRKNVILTIETYNFVLYDDNNWINEWYKINYDLLSEFSGNDSYSSINGNDQLKSKPRQNII